MDKPVKQTKEYYDFSECMAYIKEKYGKDYRDLDNKYGPNAKKNAEYLDFWHVLIDSQEISNGSVFTMFYDMFDSEEQWVVDFVDIIYKEFGDEYADIDFMVSW